MKLYIYTCNPEDVMEGDFFCSLRLTSDKEWHDSQSHYISLGTIEVELDTDTNTLRQHAIDAIDNEMETQRINFTHGMEQLKARKESLLAIEHKPDE